MPLPGVDTGSASSEECRRNWVTATEVARELKVHPTSVTRWAAAGRIPCIKVPVARTLRFDLAEVRSAIQKGATEVDPVIERNIKIREDAMRKAEETWVAETRSGVIVVVHPGQKLDILSVPERLRRELGIVDVSIIKRLSESREAPTPYSLDADIERAELELARLRAAKTERDAIDAHITERAERKVARARSEAGDEPTA
jgi:hypothetical protein